MNTRKALIAFGHVSIIAIGYTVAAMVDRTVKPKGVVENTLTTLGEFALGLNAARAFGEVYTSLCKDAFDVDVSDHFAY